MSIAVALDELRAQIGAFTTDAYLLTVRDDGRAHSVAVPVRWEGDDLVVPAGNTTAANAAARPLVALLWPPPERGGYSLIVDADRRRRRRGRRWPRGDAASRRARCCTGPRRRARAATARRCSSALKGSDADLGPEAAPRLERLGELVGGQGVVVGADAGAVGRPFERVDHVPAQELAPVEAPLRRGTVDPHVGVPVLQHAVVPAAVGPAELVVAVHDAVRMVGVVEVDDVVADEVHRHLRLAQRLHEPRRATRRARAPRVRRARRA